MEQKTRGTAHGDVHPISPPEWLTSEAAARIRDGSLPNEVPRTIFAGPGRRQNCALCDHAIEQGELTYQIASSQGEEVPLHFHVSCFRAWEDAARTASRESPGWSRGVSVDRRKESVD